jgi:hypothetical protein
MKVAEGIYSLSQTKGGHVHAFLLDDGNSLTLIDNRRISRTSSSRTRIARISAVWPR